MAKSGNQMSNDEAVKAYAKVQREMKEAEDARYAAIAADAERQRQALQRRLGTR